MSVATDDLIKRVALYSDTLEGVLVARRMVAHELPVLNELARFLSALEERLRAEAPIVAHVAMNDAKRVLAIMDGLKVGLPFEKLYEEFADERPNVPPVILLIRASIGVIRQSVEHDDTATIP